MVKRSSDVATADGNQAYLKRQKISHVISSAEDVQSSRQLKELLAFDQDSGRSRHGIQSFKAFLESLSEDKPAHRQAILKEYLEGQIPRDEDNKAAAYMDDFMKTWSFASQSNNDSLLSAIPAVLALLLRVISSMAGFEQFGLRLGRTLLQKRPLELISRGLTAQKAKEFIISPVLRLLYQLMTLDGGTLARQIFKARDYTLKWLPRNLGLRYTGEGTEDRKKPSVRTNALRFFLACVTYLPADEKRDLLIQRDITSGVFRDVSNDPAFLLVEFLETLNYILKSGDVDRETRSKFFNAINLGRLVTLYGHQSDHEIPKGMKPIDELAHEVILLACTTPDIGILRRHAGLYPRGMNPDYSNNVEGPQDFIDLGLESLEWATRFQDNVPIRNSTLSEFMQTLRPWSNSKQLALLMEIFQAAPELVADYFFNKKSFTFEPKLTATWIGYAAVLFSTAQLPVPPFFGRQGDRYGLVPPPTSIVIESILPKPITQAALSRCIFNQKSSLITFFAVRLLIVAFQKLQGVLAQYGTVSIPIWVQAANQLIDEFCRRCPVMLDAVNAFKSIPGTEIMQRQATSKLLVMYYETIPQVALESKFDVSDYLTDALRLFQQTSRGTEEAGIRVMEVENLLQIAHCSPGMRWFNKVDSLPYSPFIAMLRLSVEASTEVPLRKIKSILHSVIIEHGIMQDETKPSGLDAIISALSAHDGNLEEVYKFLDNCALRCTTTPVKYIDSADEHYEMAHRGPHRKARRPISLLLLVISEQWPFVVKCSDAANTEQIAGFIASYLAASMRLGEDRKIIKALIKTLAAESADGLRKTIETSRKHLDGIILQDFDTLLSDTDPIINMSGATEEERSEITASLFDFPRVDPDDHRALIRWRNKEVAEVIGDNYVTSLIYLLSNTHLSARKEALVAISKLCIELQKSDDYPPRDQIFLLLMEVSETAKSYIEAAPLPTTLTAFAANAITVLENPLHDLYPKINEFLCSGPKWDADKIPMIKSILDKPPHADGGRHAEVAWLLTYLSSALRTAADMKIFHNHHVFERILSLYNDAYISMSSKLEILRVLARATSITDGGTTLLTRFSVKSWLEGQSRIEPREVALSVLLERIFESCNKEKIETWSGSTTPSAPTHLSVVASTTSSSNGFFSKSTKFSSNGHLLLAL